MEEIFNSLQKLISDLTGLNADDLKPENTFEELALDSLTMVQLVIELKELYEVELSIGDMFSNPTLGGLAETILKTKG